MLNTAAISERSRTLTVRAVGTADGIQGVGVPTANAESARSSQVIHAHPAGRHDRCLRWFAAFPLVNLRVSKPVFG